MRAIADAGFKGYVAHEFFHCAIPTQVYCRRQICAMSRHLSDVVPKIYR